MTKYTAQIYYKDDLDVNNIQHLTERMRILPVFKTIANVKDWVLRTHANMDNVREVCILKISTRTGRRKIHGYYDWDGKKLALNKGRDAWIHNVFYELN